MKFGYAVAVVAAAATQAAAIEPAHHGQPAHHPHPEHPALKDGIGACGLPGGKCQEAKGAARAVAEALRGGVAKGHYESGAISAFCKVPGTKGCNEKWAAVERIGAAAERAHRAISAREANADAQAHFEPFVQDYSEIPGEPLAAVGGELEARDAKNKWVNFCGVPGSACGKRDLEGLEARDARKGWINFCGVPGSACGKRDAEIQLETRDAKNKWINFCGVPGSACGKKRSAEAEAEPKNKWINFCGVPGSACGKKRSAEAEADPKRGGWVNFCGVPGSACGKRDIEEVAPTQFNYTGYCAGPREVCYDKRSISDDQYSYKEYCDVPGAECATTHGLEVRDPKNKWVNFCGVPGSACGRKRDAEPKNKWINFCGVPGSACGKRDVEEVQNAIRQFNPQIEKEECYQEGQPCDLILKARDALQHVQAREAEFQSDDWESVAVDDEEATLEARDADPKKHKHHQVMKGGQINFCGVPGSQCGKRDAEADPKKHKHHKVMKGGQINFCGVPGSQCGKRDALADPKKHKHHQVMKGGQINFCGVPGSQCGKRDAQFHHLKENGGSLPAKFHAWTAKHNEAAAKKWEEQCHRPGGACHIAARAIEELEEAINEGLAEIE